MRPPPCPLVEDADSGTVEPEAVVPGFVALGLVALGLVGLVVPDVGDSVGRVVPLPVAPAEGDPCAVELEGPLSAEEEEAAGGASVWVGVPGGA